jgi:hypothetical protein
MAENLDNDDTDKTPLLKIKKPRPPPSIKQMENFKKMAEKRAENVQKRKEEKLFEAQKALVESTFKKAGEKGGVSAKQEREPLVPNIKKLKEEKATIQFKIEEQSSDSEEEIPEPIVKQKNIKTKQIVPVVPVKKEKKKTAPAPIIEESDTDYSSDSSEEIIVIKRGKKKPKAAKVAKAIKHEDVSEDDEQEYVAESQKPTSNFLNFFC